MGFTKKKRLILLDIDDTLFRCDTFVALIKHYLSDNVFKLIFLPRLIFLAALFKLGLVSNITLKKNALMVLSGEKRAALIKRANRLIDRLFAKKLNRAVSEAVRKMAASGLYDIIVISASPSFYIDLIGKRINAAHTIATHIKFDENDILQAELIGKNCKHEEKITRLKEIIDLNDYDLQNSYAFSDSITDLPMFELAGRPVAVTPDSGLRSHAVKKGYLIIN
jgi:HAD superfamily hydrolase (TIGR01490 family)